MTHPIRRSCALLLTAALLFFACKSEEEKRREAAQAELEKAQAQAREAQEQLAEAQKKLAETAAKAGGDFGAELGKAGEALGAQAAAAGMQAAAAGMQAAGAALNGVLGAATGMQAAAGKAPLVDFRALKGLLPEKIGRLSRVSATGEKSSGMGFGISEATGKYESGDARLKVKLLDTAGVGGMALMALGVSMVEIDKESDDGYEKTGTLAGNRSYEKYDGKAKRGELKVIVGNRFVVDVEGRGVAMEDMKDVIGKIDLGKLQKLGAEAK